MPIMRIPRRELGTVRRFVPTDKEAEIGAGTKDYVRWQFAGMVREEFGPEGATAEEIYRRVLGPKGLTADATMELLNAAVQDGYFTRE